ncbi:MAG: hypothetical protein OHK93_000127 [Ramalina farinacea]|uniref:rRNA adenine N(6)-methyltransferase n=1 Tax=Ramalina farinacea TaxID=258253 RepID=A0AA43QEB6_9LECA|nr:hypothetical protein [Ramalina farinacea]
MSLSAQASLIKRLGLPKYRGSYPRVSVTSSSLCDDIIKRLAPSLKPYEGCTIIDHNPGVGLFSSKLHDFLRPRSHVLLEPHWKKHAPYLQPLLDAPDSHYHHRDWTDARVRDSSRYEAEGLTPGPGDPASHATLHIFNSAGSAVRNIRGNSFPTHVTSATEFAMDTKKQLNFHARGPTRMLLWCEDGDKKPILPRTIDSRRKLAFFLEAYCHVNEIVGFGGSEKQAQREQSLIIASSRMARQRMRDNDIYTPPHRAAPALEVADERDQVISRYWHEELRDLEASFAAGRHVPDEQPTPEFERLRHLRRWRRQDTKEVLPALELADEQDAIDSLDLESYNPALSPQRRKEITQEIDARTATLHATIASWPPKKWRRFYYLSDDRRALHMPPGPLLMWDRRAYEPFTASESEFSPNRKLALLDFQSKPAEEILPLEGHQHLYYEMLVGAMTSQGGPTGLHFLKQITPGAYDALVPKVTEFGDAREGGGGIWRMCG